MRTATRPLNSSAVTAANAKFYRDHPEMVRDGKPIAIDPSAPSQAQYRKEWMDAYAANGGGVTTNDKKAAANEVSKAKTKANESFGNGSPTSPVAPCPKEPAPPVNRAIVVAPPPGPPPSNQTRCKLVRSNLVCSHGRRPSPAGLLMVVPSGTANGDTISCQGTLEGGCGEHIDWSIDVYRRKGSSTSFTARALEAELRGVFGLERASPKVYRVSASACQGGPSSYEIRAYPPGAVGFRLDSQRLFRNIYECLKKLPISEEKRGEWSAKWFQGAVEYSGSWQEDKPSHRVYYEKKWQGGFDPLVGGGIEAPVYPLNIVPPWLVRWVKAGLYIEVNFGLKVQVGVKGKYWPDTGANEWSEKFISATGEGKVTPSVKFELIDEDVVQAAISGETGISVSGTGAFDQVPAVEIKAGWDGIKAKATIKAAWGWVELSREFQLLGPEPLIDYDHQFV